MSHPGNPRQPAQIAIEQGEYSLDYVEFNRQVDAFAEHLIEHDLHRGDVVATLLDSSISLVIALFGTLRAGGVYLPVTPDQPDQRIAFILHDSRARFVVASDRNRLPPDCTAHWLACDPNGSPISGSPLPDPPEPDDPAYLIYTSGSTGQPKGVLIPHAGLANTMLAQQAALAVTPADRILQFASIGFDASIAEICLAMLSGATLVIPPPVIRNSLDALRCYLRDQRITLVTLPPAILAQLDLSGHDLHLRYVLSAGSALAAETAQRLAQHTGLINAYGPSEASVCATLHHVDPTTRFRESAPIGRPIAGTTAYVLDDNLQQVPVGVPGELYLGGQGVGHGYWRRPALTAAHFIPDPFSATPGTRLYRTGDRCEWLPDGNLRFLGRKDNQIKLRGIRIECGEIEAALRQHPAVADAAVRLHEGPAGPMLVGYHVAPPGADAAPEALLRKWLRSLLPDTLIPNTLMALDALPLTRNGKLNPDALPVPPTTQSHRAPNNALEAELATLFARYLNLEQVGTEDSFFALGGHSLLAGQVIAEANHTLGLTLSVRDLFEQPTAAGLAQCALQQRLSAKRDHDNTSPRAMPHPTRLPLSFAQQRLWFFSQLSPDSTAYHVPIGFELHGRLCRATLAAALTRLVTRHAALRTRFPADTQGQPHVVIDAPPALFPLGLHHADNDQTAYALLSHLTARPFTLSSGPLFRADLISVSERQQWLLLEAHHSILDGHSVELICRELSALYRQPQAELGSEGLTCMDVTLWQRQLDYSEDYAYWSQQLAGVPPSLALQTDRPRPPVASHQGAQRSRTLPDSLVQQIDCMARAHHVTPFVLLLSVFNVLLFRYSDQPTFAVGTPVSGRNHAALAQVVGLLANMLCLRADLWSGMRFTDCLQQARDTVRDALDHQTLPFDALVEHLAPERSAAQTPLFQVTFTYQTLQAVTLDLPDATATLIDLPTHSAKFDLSLGVHRLGDTCIITSEYATDLFDAATIDRLLEHYVALLARFVSQPNSEIGFDYLSERERRQLLLDWNATTVRWPRHPNLLERIAAHAASAPDQGAVVQAGITLLTYGDLCRQAAHAAGWLRQLGPHPSGNPVLILAKRSPDAVVAMLATVWAGYAYLPLDADLPDARIQLIIADAQPYSILTHSQLRSRLPASATPILCVDQLCKGERCEDEASADAQLPPANYSDDDTAYVIYTSGSTGIPKGTAITHHSLLNLVHWHLQCYQLTPDARTSLLSSLSFDAAAWEIWPTLFAGATVVIAEDTARQDPAALVDWLARERITHSFVPTPVTNLLLADWPRYARPLPALSAILTGGDVLRYGAPANAGFQVYNHYGPTENTVVTTAARVPEGTTAPSIGRPIANHRVYLLDRNLVPVPVGVAGELYLAGDGLSPGYPGQPALTAERFVPDPFGKPGARLYRTGDRARWQADGELAFLGRMDRQINLRGFRVECGEIEATLAQHPAIQQAAVFPHASAERDIALWAYVVRSPDAPLDTEGLTRDLARTLPAHMLPTGIVELTALPTTPSGKVDYRHLPKPQRRLTGIAPTTDRGRQLATHWCDMLGIEAVGLDDNFFTLGGHSLLATQLLARIHEATGQTMPLADFFASPTLRAMENALAATEPTPALSVTPLHPSNVLPLTYTQLDFWFIYLGTGSLWPIAGGWQCVGIQSIALLQTAIDQVIRTEPVFWMRVSRWLPRQQLQPVKPLHIPITTLQCASTTERQQRTQRILDQLAAEPLDLKNPPACRFHLIQQNADNLVVGYCFSHLCVDGAGLGILQRKVFARYAALLKDKDTNLPAMRTELAAYIAWERADSTPQRIKQARQNWLLALTAQRPLQLPTSDSNQERPFHRMTVSLPAFNGLLALSQRHQCGVQATVLALVARAVARITGNTSLCITVVFAARSSPETMDLVAPVMRELPVPIQVDSHASLDDSIMDSHRALQAALARDVGPWIVPLSLLEIHRWPRPLKWLVLDGIAGTLGRAVARLGARLQLYGDFLRDYLAFLPLPARRKTTAAWLHLNLHPNLLAETTPSEMQVTHLPVSSSALPEWVDGALDVAMQRNNRGDVELIVRGPRTDSDVYPQLITALQAALEECA